jgi:hypothetical protein
MPKPYPREFRDDVVAIARKGTSPLDRLGVSDCRNHLACPATHNAERLFPRLRAA